VSQVLTLFTTPVVYLYVGKLGCVIAWIVGSSEAQAAAGAE
jgi:hypothetical protein